MPAKTGADDDLEQVGVLIARNMLEHALRRLLRGLLRREVATVHLPSATVHTGKIHLEGIGTVLAVAGELGASLAQLLPVLAAAGAYAADLASHG
jgi:hypothetical protein